MKLGKNEKKILVLLLERYLLANVPYRFGVSRPLDGNSIKRLAEDVFIFKDIYKLNSNYILNKIVVSLSYSLNNLFKKGFVKKATPIYKYRWESLAELYDAPDYKGGFWIHDLTGFIAQEYKDGKIIKNKISVPRFESLPLHTKIWWIITDKGKEMAEKIKLRPEIKKWLLRKDVKDNKKNKEIDSLVISKGY